MWREQNLSIHPKMNPTTLNTTRRYAKRHTLTQMEMEDIQKEEEERAKGAMSPLPSGSDKLSNEVPSTTLDKISPIPEEEEASHMGEINVDMWDNLTILVEKHKNMEMDQRPRPKRYIMSKENKERLKDMNDVLTVFLRSRNDITITELNAIHYSAAVILAGTAINHTTTKRTKRDPDEIIKKKIIKVRKWIGKLTAINNGKRLTAPVKNLSRTTQQHPC